MCNAFMFVQPLGGWREIHVSRTKTAVDWARYVKWLVDHPRFANVRRITLVCDNLNTHAMGSLYAAFPAGLMRLKSGWRISAIVSAILVVTGVLYLTVQSALVPAEFVTSRVPKNVLPYAYVLACVVVAVAFALIWSIRILTLPGICAHFLRSTTDHVASAIPPLLFVLALLCVSRLTGGIGGSLSVINTESFLSFNSGGGPSLKAIQPLIVEVRADDGPSYYFFVWAQTRQQNEFGGTTTTTERRFSRFAGWFIPDHLRGAPNRIILEIRKPDLIGSYWLPFLKEGEARCEAELRGVGKYESYSQNFDLDLKFRVIGVSTTDNLWKYLRRQVEEQALSLIVKSATQGTSRQSLERASRESPLSSEETNDLAKSYGRLGDLYHQASMYADAAEVYRRKVLALRYILLGGTRAETWEIAEAKKELSQTYNNVAWQFATDPRVEARHGIRALGYAKKACELSEWEDGMYLDTLAAAYAETGDYAQAIQWQSKAIDLLPERFAADAQGRLSFYESGEAFRESPP